MSHEHSMKDKCERARDTWGVKEQLIKYTDTKVLTQWHNLHIEEISVESVVMQVFQPWLSSLLLAAHSLASFCLPFIHNCLCSKRK